MARGDRRRAAAAPCHQGRADIRRRQHEVCDLARDHALRHAAVLGLQRVLCDDEPAARLDRPRALRPVGAGSREHDGHGAWAVRQRHRLEEKIERHARAMARLRLRHVKQAALHREIGSGRDDVEMVGLDAHAFGGLPHRHLRLAGQQVHHHAGVRGIEVLHQDESHAVRVRQGADKPLAGVETACGRADSDDDECVCFDRSFRRGRPPRARRRQFPLRGLWAARCHFAPFSRPCTPGMQETALARLGATGRINRPLE